MPQTLHPLNSRRRRSAMALLHSPSRWGGCILQLNRVAGTCLATKSTSSLAANSGTSVSDERAVPREAKIASRARVSSWSFIVEANRRHLKQWKINLNLIVKRLEKMKNNLRNKLLQQDVLYRDTLGATEPSFVSPCVKI